MDLILDPMDDYLLTPYVYPSWVPETSMWRQFASLLAISLVGAFILYFLTAGFVYHFIFDKTLVKHPLFIKDQVTLEIKYATKSMPIMGFLTTFLFVAEVQGYSKLYDNISDSVLGWWSIPIQVVTFILFTDCLIYWIHRGLHHRSIYKYIHKGHHHWKVTTPFASHAFHPIDGFLQSIPYHIYVFLFPLHKVTYLVLFMLVNVWTISIHDGYYKVPKLFEPVVNGAAHHTDHHLFYNYNYGQYFTLWDRLCGSFRYPSALEGQGPLEAIRSMNGKNGHVSDSDKMK